MTRRRFLGVTTAGAAAAVVPGCSPPPPEKIVPYVHRPPEVVPGEPTYYATSCTRAGHAIGLLAETREGRPIKMEGNPHHPMSLGATGMWEQASVYDLYDPDRARGVLHRNEPSTWEGLTEAMAPQGGRPHEAEGGGLHLLLEPTSSLCTGWMLDRLRQRLPKATVWFDPTTADTHGWEATRRLFGRAVEPHYDFTRIERAVALDADFLTAGPASLRWAHDFATKRHLEHPQDATNRLYSVGPLMSVTHAMADHRLAVRSAEVHGVALDLLVAVAKQVGAPDAAAALVAEHRPASAHAEWVAAAADDLARHRGRAAVVVGPHQPAEVHVLGHAINVLLESVGETVWFARSPIVGAGGPAFDVGNLLDALEAEEVRTLVVCGGNPAYAAPHRRAWREHAPKAETFVHLAAYRNETAQQADWVVAEAHYLESWGAPRAYDGTITVTQPAIRPLFAGRTTDQVLSLLVGEPSVSGRDLLARAWSDVRSESERLPPLREALAEGLVDGSAHAKVRVEPAWDRVVDAARSAPTSSGDYELVLRPDPRLRDGRQANNPLLQECPSPVTKTVWDNPALVAPQDAVTLGVGTGDVVRLATSDGALELPVYVQPGQARGVIGLHLGHGRAGDESVARGAGTDVGDVRSADRPWRIDDVEVSTTGETREVVTTQQEGRMHDRHLVLHQTLSEWKNDPHFAEPHDHEPPSIYPERLERAPQWGMNIDLTTCTGCSTCVVACMVENNVPVVGKPQVGMGREMHWLRIDRYYTGDEADPDVHMQPMLCQHCERAPCEYVCPVNATVHSSDGLNEMVYNRCVGTRFCSNNCPYKVRRFNYFEWNGNLPETVKLMKNPDVTVRSRGVMEKCTYCVQRIRRQQIEASLHDVPLREVGLQTACQQACPSRAIVFGLVSDPDSEVSQRNALLHAYKVLQDLGTHPRTLYLADIDNPNPKVTS
ncbi:MAG: 4Fe-4S dicluster domain-containing protein [Myxococcota bacterium]